jgi:hypothetical protein
MELGTLAFLRKGARVKRTRQDNVGRLVGLILAALAWCSSAAAQAPPVTVEYYHLDAVGSVRLVTDASGAEVQRHDYFPFGEEWIPQPTTGDTRRFAAKERDAETGLDYFGAEWPRCQVGILMSTPPRCSERVVLAQVFDQSTHETTWLRVPALATPVGRCRTERKSESRSRNDH